MNNTFSTQQKTLSSLSTSEVNSLQNTLIKSQKFTKYLKPSATAILPRSSRHDPHLGRNKQESKENSNRRQGSCHDRCKADGV